MNHHALLPFCLLLCAFILLPVFLTDLPAQESQNKFFPYLFLNGNLQAGIPTQVFQRQGQETGYGGGGVFLVQLGRRPVFGGLDVAMQRFDSEDITFEEIIGGVVEEFRQATKNNAFLAHAVVRVQPWDNGLFRPYLDGLCGTKNLFTRTTVENLNTEDSESNTDRKDWSLSYGFALGLQLGVFRNEAVTIDVRCSYLTGNATTFLVRRPGVTRPFFAPIDAFEEKRAPASMLIPQLGVTVDLSTVDYY